MDGVWRAGQVRAAERRLLAELPPGALMARAARAVAIEAAAMIGFTYGARVLLLVGWGDNGADALFAGASLARRGVQVGAALADVKRTNGAALSAYLAAGGRIVELPQAGPVDAIVDGLVGLGASGPLRPALLPLVDYAARSNAPVLSVDLPSGIDPDTGAVAGPAITAAVTVCLGALKPGLLVGPGRVRAGLIRFVDLGLADYLSDDRADDRADDLSDDRAEPAAWQLTDADIDSTVHVPGPADDKYSRGVVGIVAGSQAYPGAAQLCVGAARLGGVGAVRYVGHAADEVVRRYPEALVAGTVGEAGRVQAWVVGPGLADTVDAVSSLHAVLETEVPVVVDADGLNIIAARIELRELLYQRSAATILTPHDREFERLFGPVGADRIGAARRTAVESGATVLLKGYATVVATPAGRCYLNHTGHPALATAGSGDVLAGLVGSLLASGVEAGMAAATAAYVHGRAAARAAADGPLVASDLLATLRTELARNRPTAPTSGHRRVS